MDSLLRDRLLRLTGIELRKFNPLQPRDPGGEGGGQWIKAAVGNLIDAITDDDEDDLDDVDDLEPKQLAQLSKGDFQVAAYLDAQGWHGPEGGRVVTVTEGSKDDLAEVEVAFTPEQAGRAAEALDQMIQATKGPMPTEADPERGVTHLASGVTPDGITYGAFFDVDGDAGFENVAIVAVTTASVADPTVFLDWPSDRVSGTPAEAAWIAEALRKMAASAADDVRSSVDAELRHRTLLLLGVELRARGYNPAPGRQVFTQEGAKKYGLPIGATITPGMRRLTEAQQQKVADLPEAQREKYQAARKAGSTHTQSLAAAKAPRKAAKKAAPADVASRLEAAGSREEAHELLEGLSAGELKAVADAADISYGSKDTKAKIKKDLVFHTVGRRLTADAITGEAKEKAAVDRQDRIDKVKGTAATLAEVLQIVNDGGSNEALKHRINARVKRGDLDEKTRDRLIEAVDNRTVGEAVARIAEQNGLTVTAEAGDVVAWTPETGLLGLQGGGFRRGTFVSVVRPGVQYDPGDGKIAVVQGLAEEATPDEIADFKKAADRKKAREAAESPAPSAYDRLLGDGTGAITHKPTRDVLEQMEAHDWKLTSAHPAGGMVTFTAPDGRVMTLIYGGNGSPTFLRGQNLGAQKVTYKAALAHAVTPTPPELSYTKPNILTASDNLDLPRPLDRDSGPLQSAQRKLQGGTPTGEVADLLREDAKRRREVADLHRNTGDTSRAKAAEREADTLDRYADELDRMDAELKEHNALLDRLRDAPLDIRPPKARTPKPEPAATPLADLPEAQRRNYEAILRNAADGGTTKSLGTSSATKQRNRHIDDLVTEGYLESGDGESFTLTDKGRQHIGDAQPFSEKAAVEKFETPDAPSADQLATGLGSRTDFDHGAGNYLDDVQAKLDAGERPAAIAKMLDSDAQRLADSIQIRHGGSWNIATSDEFQAENARRLAEGKIRVERLRALAERLRQAQIRRPRTTAKPEPADPSESLRDELDPSPATVKQRLLDIAKTANLATAEEEAGRYLDSLGLTAPQLKALAQGMDVPLIPGGKAQHRKDILKVLVSGHLTTRVLQNMSGLGPATRREPGPAKLRVGDAIDVDGERDGVRLVADDGTIATWKGRRIPPWSPIKVTKVDEDPAVDPTPTDPSEALRDDLDLKKVPELKQMLRDAGLPVSGKKRELVDRLVEHQAVGAPDAPTVRPSGLPADRKPVSADFDDLAERVSQLGGLTEQQRLEIFQDLNAVELARLARKFQGTAASVSLAGRNRDQGLRLPEGLTTEEKRRWLAKKLTEQRHFWRSEAQDDVELRDRMLQWELRDTPGRDEFEAYWTRGEGLARWLGRPHEWTTLRNLLRKHPGIRDPEGLATKYFHKVKGFYPGADLHRVEHGKPPRGDRIGPG